MENGGLGQWLMTTLFGDRFGGGQGGAQQQPEDPAVQAARNIWGAEPGVDPAVIAASNIWGGGNMPAQPEQKGPLGEILGFLGGSEFNGHVDRMSGNDGYKTRHMREGAAGRHQGGYETAGMRKNDPEQWKAYKKLAREAGYDPKEERKSPRTTLQPRG